MKTTFSPIQESDRKWFLIDAKDQILGRVASRVAFFLMGKHKPAYAPHLDMGDHVIVINADKIRVTGRKFLLKKYTRYSGYPGGLRVTEFHQLFRQYPERVLFHAVKGMLPKTQLGRQMLRKLKVYAGAEHPHTAQKPENIPFN